MTAVTAGLLARTRAARLDELLADGAQPEPGTLLAARAAQLEGHRTALGQAWFAVRDRARRPHPALVTNRVPIASREVIEADELVCGLVARLWGPCPVPVRGLAAARLLLTDGAGPVYGGGDLHRALRTVLAALE